MKQDLYQSITDSIIALLESGQPLQWVKPWASDPGSSSLPQNAVSHKTYRGINVLNLWCEQLKHGYRTPLWATYKQWSSVGGQVRRGEKATSCVFWNFFEKSSPTSDNPDNTKKIPFLRSYAVFNRDQIDNLPELPAPTVPDRPALERIPHADIFFAGTRARVSHGGHRAFYTSADDYIQMPPFDYFKDPPSYYATLAHECIHWTGHADRLKRDLGNRFGSEAYAMEELIAELGSAFTLGHLGIQSVPREDHAAYLSHWLTVLKNDKHAIFKASTLAQQAADYLGATAGGDGEGEEN